MSNVEYLHTRAEEHLRRAESGAAETIETTRVDTHTSDMDDSWRSSVDRALGETKGSLDGLRHSMSVLTGAVGILASLMVGGFAFLGFQISQVSSKVDAIPRVLSEEFRAMRAEMSAQTSAIANSITATRQAQPAPVPPAQKQ